MSVAYSISPESRRRGTRRGAATRSSLAGYTNVAELRNGFRIAWRWRHERRWHLGTVRTREEAETLRAKLREVLARGEEPGPLPKYDVRVDRQASAPPRRSETELAERRARLKAQLAPDAERCTVCRMLKPCSPCLDEISESIRRARRGDS